jgi:hypothetical protein
LTIHVSSKIKLGDVILWRSLQPDRLPNSTTGCVEDVARAERLLADGDDEVTIICWVMDKDEPEVVVISFQFNPEVISIEKLTVRSPGQF